MQRVALFLLAVGFPAVYYVDGRENTNRYQYRHILVRLSRYLHRFATEFPPRRKQPPPGPTAG